MRISNYNYLLYISLCWHYIEIEAKRTGKLAQRDSLEDTKPKQGMRGIAPPAVSPETIKFDKVTSTSSEKPLIEERNRFIRQWSGGDPVRPMAPPSVFTEHLKTVAVETESSTTKNSILIGLPVVVPVFGGMVPGGAPLETEATLFLLPVKPTLAPPALTKEALIPPTPKTVTVEAPMTSTPPPMTLTQTTLSTVFSWEPTIAPPAVTKETIPPSPPPTPITTNTKKVGNTMAPPSVTKEPIRPVTIATKNSTTNQSGLANRTRTIYRICGYPIYCDREQCRSMNITSVPLRECETQGGAVIFGIVIVVMGLLIVAGNCLLPIVVWKQPDMQNQYNYIKVSLAASDMILGLMLLFSVLPNIVWTRNATEREIVNVVLFSGNNSPISVISGSILVLTVQSSILHLTFLSIERFIAIKWSFWHRLRKTSTVVWTIFLLWFLSLLGAFLPAAFPQYYEFTYQPALLIYMMTIKPLPDGTLGYHGIVYSLITFGLPYMVLVVFTVSTGVVVHQKVKSSKKQLGGDNGIATVSSSQNDGPASPRPAAKARKLRPDIAVFKTLIFMIFAFSITLLPVTVVFILFNIGYFTCHNYTAYFVVTYYFMALNSFVNVVIYSARDKRFRTAVAETFFTRKKMIFLDTTSKKTNSNMPSTSV